ncbi:MAG: allene oxide cyclase barrel-like domain-containing protein [Sporichthyaceae bacterium]
MQQNRTVAAAGVAALLAGALGVGAAQAADTIQIKVNEFETGYSDTIDDEDGPEAGDSFTFRSRLMQAGVKVGKDRGTCVFTRIIGDGDDPTGAVIRCRVTLTFFDEGTITVADKIRVDFTNEEFRATLPIVKSTGTYAGASGKVRVVQVSEKKSRLTITYTK